MSNGIKKGNLTIRFDVTNVDGKDILISIIFPDNINLLQDKVYIDDYAIVIDTNTITKANTETYIGILQDKDGTPQVFFNTQEPSIMGATVIANIIYYYTEVSSAIARYIIDNNCQIVPMEHTIIGAMTLVNPEYYRKDI